MLCCIGNYIVSSPWICKCFSSSWTAISRYRTHRWGNRYFIEYVIFLGPCYVTFFSALTFISVQTIVLHICLLLLDVALASHNASKAVVSFISLPSCLYYLTIILSWCFPDGKKLCGSYNAGSSCSSCDFTEKYCTEI